MGKIYFRTVTWNAEKTLDRCVDSVLKQTCRADDIIYYICNNPNTQPDPTEAMVRELAAREPRIRAFYNDRNMVWKLPDNQEFVELTRALNDDDYLCYLDCDDAYELDFLENMLPFMEENELDFACCGSAFIDAATGKTVGERVLQKPLIMKTPQELSNLFPVYHQFMRTNWGKVISGRMARMLYTPLDLKERNVTYSGDTFMVFSMLRHARRIGIYPKVLHRYYVWPGSASYHYNPGRPDADATLHNVAVEYLSAFGPINAQNRFFLARVYANAVRDTVGVLSNTSMPPAEKLHECRRIAEMPATQENFSFEHPEIERSRRALLEVVLNCAGISDEAAKADFHALVSFFAPNCAPAVLPENAELFITEGLIDAVLGNDVDTLLSELLRLFHESKYTKKYDYPAMIRALSENKPLLENVGDKKFLRRHGDVYLAVWRGQYEEALDAMTGELLDGEKADEAYLQLYLSLAALENQGQAFVFGKVRLAELYLKQGDNDGCRTVLGELDEMGVEENEEIAALKERLKMKK